MFTTAVNIFLMHSREHINFNFWVSFVWRWRQINSWNVPQNNFTNRSKLPKWSPRIVEIVHHFSGTFRHILPVTYDYYSYRISTSISFNDSGALVLWHIIRTDASYNLVKGQIHFNQFEVFRLLSSSVTIFLKRCKKISE